MLFVRTMDYITDPTKPKGTLIPVELFDIVQLLSNKIDNAEQF